MYYCSIAARFPPARWRWTLPRASSSCTPAAWCTLVRLVCCCAVRWHLLLCGAVALDAAVRCGGTPGLEGAAMHAWCTGAAAVAFDLDAHSLALLVYAGPAAGSSLSARSAVLAGLCFSCRASNMGPIINLLPLPPCPPRSFSCRPEKPQHPAEPVRAVWAGKWQTHRPQRRSAASGGGSIQSCMAFARCCVRLCRCGAP